MVLQHPDQEQTFTDLANMFLSYTKTVFWLEECCRRYIYIFTDTRDAATVKASPDLG